MAGGLGKKGRRMRGAGRPQEGLPALSTLADLPSVGDLRVDGNQRAAYERACARLTRSEGVPAGELRLGCVVRLDRGFPAVACEDGLRRAEFAAQLTKGASSRVAVGDWVCARVPAGHDMGLIQEVLPRRSDLARWRGSARGERQTLAANVDVVIAAQALGAGAVSCAWLARTAVVARDCGCGLSVVLTKADRVLPEELGQYVRQVHSVLGQDVTVVASCAVAPTGASAAHGNDAVSTHDAGRAAAALGAGALWGAQAVRDLVATGTVGIVLGESGAGKSTLLNALLGRTVLATGAVRERDDRGRHTTVSRRMVALPGGGVLVDAPGLRSLPLVGHERGLALSFPELSEAAHDCRFRDCTHTHEPGCAVCAGLEEGRFTFERADTYRALAAEMRKSAVMLDPDVVL